MFVMKSEVVISFRVFLETFVIDGASQFQNFRMKYSKSHTPVLYKVVTVRLGCDNTCSRCFPEELTDA
jgi:hypothetical protein